jgi:transcription termination/antitermination protein NusG
MAKQWYIVHTHTGFEDKVKEALQERIRSAGQQELFGDILVPTEQVVEMVKGSRKTSSRKFFPGYILINMELNDSTWHTVHDTPRVTGFVGDNLNPQPLPENDALKIIGRIEEGATTPKPKVIFESGDPVRVIEGPFANFQGVIEEVYPDKGRVKVMVSIFGRSTPVELEYIQVSKN